jgi:type I restriction enzyme S subunit
MMGYFENTDLPDGWVKTSLDIVAEWASGGTPSRSNPKYFDGDIPWIKTGELGDKFIYATEEHISQDALLNSSAKIFPKGSVGIAMYGATIGKLSIWGMNASTNQACAVGIPFHDILTKEYLYYFLFSEKQGFVDSGKGGAQPNISQSIIKSWPIPLPPLPEQKRIVAKIEELLSELDKGIESFKTAREQLKVYRQALLKHAFEGKLTAAWREANKDKLETADALLKRIQAERAERYKQQVKDWEKVTKEWEKSAKIGSKPGKPSQPKELPPLTAEELAELPELPESWGWVHAEEISYFITKGTTPEKKLLGTSGEIPFVKVYNLTKSGHLDFTIDPTFVSRKTHEGFLARSKVYPGDVLMNIVGPPLGKVSIVPDTYNEWNINQAIARFRSPYVVNKYLAYYLLAETTVRLITKKSKATAGQFNLTLEICRDVFIPLCCEREQVEIIKLIDEKLSEIDNLDQTISTALQQSEALRQSILKKAFSGQLVPQDPNDEPAAELLARIKAERTVVGARSQTRPGATATDATNSKAKTKPDKNGRVTDRAPTKNISK